jgi:transcriptional regulator GlxA family with amidase domain
VPDVAARDWCAAGPSLNRFRLSNLVPNRCHSRRRQSKPSAVASAFQFLKWSLPEFSESDALTRKANQAEYSARMHRVLEHIDRHLDQELDLRALARVANFSAFHFHRVFFSWTGETRRHGGLPLRNSAILVRNSAIQVSQVGPLVPIMSAPFQQELP